MLSIEARLTTGTYDAAAADDRDVVEWPPHPARLFCALVAGARDETDWGVLRWLERQAVPQVVAAASFGVLERSGYVVTNRREAKGGSQVHPARTNQLRSRRASLPAAPIVRFVWPDLTADEERIGFLRSLARRVPYLGRSTGAVLLDVADSLAQVEGLDTYEPCELQDAESMLRTPYPGYVDALRAAHAENRPAWEVGQARGYRIQRDSAEHSAVVAPSPYHDLVIFRFSGIRPDGRLAARFTAALRRAVMSCVDDPLPAALHGHAADGRPHVAFLALPDVGHPHADGHLLGLAVAIPPMTARERVTVLRGLLAGREEGCFPLRMPRLGTVELRYQPGHVRPWGATPERWRRGAKHWVAATPVVLDRYPRGGNIEAEVVRSCSWAGLPEPVDVVVSTEPLQSGAVRLHPPDLPEQVRGRLFRHVSLTFDSIVHGPVLLGAGRYFGAGLFAPAPNEEAA